MKEITLGSQEFLRVHTEAGQVDVNTCHRDDQGKEVVQVDIIPNEPKGRKLIGSASNRIILEDNSGKRFLVKNNKGHTYNLLSDSLFKMCEDLEKVDTLKIGESTKAIFSFGSGSCEYEVTRTE